LWPQRLATTSVSNYRHYADPDNSRTLRVMCRTQRERRRGLRLLGWRAPHSCATLPLTLLKRRCSEPMAPTASGVTVRALLTGLFLTLLGSGCGGREVHGEADAGADHDVVSDAAMGLETSADVAAVCPGAEGRNDDAGILCETVNYEIDCVCFTDVSYGECACDTGNGAAHVFSTCPCCPSASQTLSICAADY
jgi:hypothetical protein